jgi:hypothetical protein
MMENPEKGALGRTVGKQDIGSQDIRRQYCDQETGEYILTGDECDKLFLRMVPEITLRSV